MFSFSYSLHIKNHDFKMHWKLWPPHPRVQMHAMHWQFFKVFIIPVAWFCFFLQFFATWPCRLFLYCKVCKQSSNLLITERPFRWLKYPVSIFIHFVPHVFGFILSMNLFFQLIHLVQIFFFSLTENRVPFCRFFKAYPAASWTKLKIRLYSSVTVKFTGWLPLTNVHFSSHKRFVVSSEHYVWSHLYSCASFTRWFRILYCNFLTHSLAVHKKRWWNEVFLASFLPLSKNKITLWICTSHVLFGLIHCTPNGFDDFQLILLTSSMSIFQSLHFYSVFEL